MVEDTNATWTPSDYLPALQRLSQLQDQLTTLRTLLSSTIHPLCTAITSSSPESFYAHFAGSAAVARASVENFRAVWEDKETARVLGRVRESLANDAEAPAVGGRWWDEKIDLDMGAERGVEGAEKAKAGIDGERLGEKGTAEEEVEGVVRAFGEREPECVVEYRAPGEGFTVTVPTGSRRLVFEIQCLETPLDDATHFRVICSGETRLHEAITRCLELRPRKRDLVYTLDMIAAYANLGTAKCDKCHRALDSSAMIPSVRMRKPRKDEWERADSDWDVLHEGCL